jgi:hypothetical protein
VTVKKLAEALEYKDHRKLLPLIRRGKAEFENKTAVLKMRTPSGLQMVTVINYHGCVRAAMLSGAPTVRSGCR